MISRSLVVVAMLAASSSADSRRPAPSKLSKAAGAEFALAVAAEKRGDLGIAIDHYKKSLELVVHPNTVFNKADVEARFGYTHDAIASYAMYLSLVPNASDRAAVLASIKKLTVRTSKVIIRGDESCAPLSTAYVFVDGVLVSKPGGKTRSLSVQVRPGNHQIDAVTAISFGTTRVKTAGAGPNNFSVCIPTHVDGNVVVQHVQGIAVSKYKFDGERTVLPTGVNRIPVSDRTFECSPIEVTAPSGDSVLYVYVAPAELQAESLTSQRAPFRCRKLAVVTRLLAF